MIQVTIQINGGKYFIFPYYSDYLGTEFMNQYLITTNNHFNAFMIILILLLILLLILILILFLTIFFFCNFPYFNLLFAENNNFSKHLNFYLIFLRLIELYGFPYILFVRGESNYKIYMRIFSSLSHLTTYFLLKLIQIPCFF